jgi:hypothetical protein
MENTLDVPVGDNAQFFIYLVDTKGKDITTYTGNEPVRAVVWAGDDRAPILSAATATFDPDQALLGQTTVIINGSATASITPGYYLIRCEIFLSGAWFEYFSGWLNLKRAPGLSVPSTVYCTLQDMMDRAGEWLPGLMSVSETTNFEAERLQARQEIDRVVVSRNRPWGWAWLQSGFISPYTSEAPDIYLGQQLALGKLMVTPEIVQAATYLSLSLVCEQQLTWSSDDVFFSRLRFYRAKYQQTLVSTVAQIDVNSDGIPDIVFNLGRFSIR